MPSLRLEAARTQVCRRVAPELFNLAYYYVTSAYVVFLLSCHLSKNSSSSNASSTLEVTFLFRILG